MVEKATAHYSLTIKQISEQRLGPYLEHSYNDVDKALELYQADRRLSSEIFYEIGLLEVALRNAIDRALSAENAYGENWIFNLSLPVDERTTKNFADSWDSLPGKYKSEDRITSNKQIKGRILAASMFRTWSNLLDQGGASGLPAPRHKADHELIWTPKRLQVAFPGGKREAGRQGKEFNRAWVHQQVKQVHVLRNRIAHHESLINGYPLPGQEDSKQTVSEGIQFCRTLARMLDRNLEKYLEQESKSLQFLDALEAAKP